MFYMFTILIGVIFLMTYYLLLAMDELLPRVEQRFCVKNLYNNFRKTFPSKMLKQITCKVGKSSYLGMGNRNEMNEGCQWRCIQTHDEHPTNILE